MLFITAILLSLLMLPLEIPLSPKPSCLWWATAWSFKYLLKFPTQCLEGTWVQPWIVFRDKFSILSTNLPFIYHHSITVIFYCPKWGFLVAYVVGNDDDLIWCCFYCYCDKTLTTAFFQRKWFMFGCWLEYIIEGNKGLDMEAGN